MFIQGNDTLRLRHIGGDHAKNISFFSRAEANMYNPSYQPPGSLVQAENSQAITIGSSPLGEPNPTPWTNYPTPTYDQQSHEQAVNNPGGLWGWFSNNKMLATVVEKAKVSNAFHCSCSRTTRLGYADPGYLSLCFRLVLKQWLPLLILKWNNIFVRILQSILLSLTKFCSL